MLNTGPHSCIWGGASNYLAPALPLPSRLGDLGSVVSSPAGSGAKPRPPTHSRYISGPQNPSSRNNALQNQSKIWGGPGQDLGACAPWPQPKTATDLLPTIQSVFERVIRPKPRRACCQIFFMLLTMEMWLLWFFWTYHSRF